MEHHESNIQGNRISSIVGPFRIVFIPCGLGFDDAREVGKALLAWRYRLSTDEIQTLDLYAQGCTFERTAEHLDIDERTARNRMQVVMNKMGVHSRERAVVIAAWFGLGRTDDRAKQEEHKPPVRLPPRS